MKKLIAALLSLGMWFGSSYAFAERDVVLTWDDVTGEDGYQIYRKLEKCDATNPSAPWVNINGVFTDVTTYTDPALANGLKVCYYVTAYNEGGESEPSNLAGTVVRPGQPQNLKVNQ